MFLWIFQVDDSPGRDIYVKNFYVNSKNQLRQRGPLNFEQTSSYEILIDCHDVYKPLNIIAQLFHIVIKSQCKERELAFERSVSKTGL